MIFTNLQLSVFLSFCYVCFSPAFFLLLLLLLFVCLLSVYLSFFYFRLFSVCLSFLNFFQSFLSLSVILNQLQPSFFSLSIYSFDFCFCSPFFLSIVWFLSNDRPTLSSFLFFVFLILKNCSNSFYFLQSNVWLSFDGKNYFLYSYSPSYGLNVSHI